jgi:hypothetical protein
MMFDRITESLHVGLNVHTTFQQDPRTKFACICRDLHATRPFVFVYSVGMRSKLLGEDMKESHLGNCITIPLARSLAPTLSCTYSPSKLEKKLWLWKS